MAPPPVIPKQAAGENIGGDAGPHQDTGDTIEQESDKESDPIIPEEMITTDPWGRVIVIPWREGDDGAPGDKYKIKAKYRRATSLNDDEEILGEARLYPEAERGPEAEETADEEEAPLTEEEQEQQNAEDAMQVATEAEERVKDYADPFSGEPNPPSKMVDNPLAKDPLEENPALNVIREVLRRQYPEEPPAPPPDRGPAPAEGLAQYDFVSLRILTQQWPMKPIHIPNATIRSPIAPMDATQEEFDAQLDIIKAQPVEVSASWWVAHMLWNTGESPEALDANMPNFEDGWCPREAYPNDNPGRGYLHTTSVAPLSEYEFFNDEGGQDPTENSFWTPKRKGVNGSAVRFMRPPAPEEGKLDSRFLPVPALQSITLPPKFEVGKQLRGETQLWDGINGHTFRFPPYCWPDELSLDDIMSGNPPNMAIDIRRIPVITGQRPAREMHSKPPPNVSSLTRRLRPVYREDREKQMRRSRRGYNPESDSPTRRSRKAHGPKQLDDGPEPERHGPSFLQYEYVYERKDPWGPEGGYEGRDYMAEREKDHAGWNRYFVINNDNLGRTIVLNGVPVRHYELAGPLPAFAVIEVDGQVGFWHGVGGRYYIPDAMSLPAKGGKKRRANAPPEGEGSPKVRRQSGTRPPKSARRQPDAPRPAQQKNVRFEGKVHVNMRGGSGGDDSSAGSVKKKGPSLSKAMQKFQKQAEKYKATQQGKNKRPVKEYAGSVAEEPDPKRRKATRPLTTAQGAQKGKEEVKKAAAAAERKKNEDFEKAAARTEKKNKDKDAAAQQEEQRRQEDAKLEELEGVPRTFLEILLSDDFDDFGRTTVDPTWSKAKIFLELVKLKTLKREPNGTVQAGGKASGTTDSKGAAAGAKDLATTGSEGPAGGKRLAIEPPAGPAPNPKRPATATATGPTTTLARRPSQALLETSIDPDLIARAALIDASREQDSPAAEQAPAAAASDEAQRRAMLWAQFTEAQRQKWLERWTGWMAVANIDSSPQALRLPKQSRPRLPWPRVTEHNAQEVQRQSGVYFYLAMVNGPEVAGTDGDGMKFVEAGTCEVHDGYFGTPGYVQGGVVAQARPWSERPTEGFEEMLRAAREDESGRAYMSDGYAARNGRPRGVLPGDLPRGPRHEELDDVGAGG